MVALKQLIVMLYVHCLSCLIMLGQYSLLIGRNKTLQSECLRTWH